MKGPRMRRPRMRRPRMRRPRMRRPKDCCTSHRKMSQEDSLHSLFALPLFVSYDQKIEGTILN